MAESVSPGPGEQSGGCQCGAVRFAVPKAPLVLYVCHCVECRKQSSSAFGISFTVARSALRGLKGTPTWWSRPTASKHTLDCAFCPACGSRLWHEGIGGTDAISVKGGSLDDLPDLRSACHIWTTRKLPGVVIPEGARQFPGEPD